MHSRPGILPVGDNAVLVDLDSLDTALALFQQLDSSTPDGVTELVPAAKTILICFDKHLSSSGQIKKWVTNAYSLILPGLDNGSSENRLVPDSPLVEIPANYNGQDLQQVAEFLDISVAELIDRHTGTDFIGAFAGFAPGFVYLTKGDPIFSNIPRLDTPRTRVPASSIAVAGDFSAIYPKESPGGWQLLGTTPAMMWDLHRSNPALIKPGFRVRFYSLSDKSINLPEKSVSGTARTTASAVTDNVADIKPGAQQSITKQPAANCVEVLSPGVQTLIQDFGRQGLTSIGVSTSGALDRQAMSAANLLAGNPVDCPVLENAMGGLQLRFHCDAVIAVTGAETSVILTTESGVRIPAAANSEMRVSAGNILKLGQARAGMRFYIAIKGSFALDPVLGSLSTDILAGLGPEPLRKGVFLPLKDDCGPVADDAITYANDNSLIDYVSGRSLPRSHQVVMLDIIMGPRDDWFAKSALADLTSQEWLVTTQSNRVGLRLQAPRPLQRIHSLELPSEGTVSGAIQVPASGQPVLFLADHPLTGGYPVIAVLASHQLDLAGQIPIGAKIRFRVIDPD